MQTTKYVSLRFCLQVSLGLFLMVATFSALAIAVPSNSTYSADDTELTRLNHFRTDLKTFMKLSKEEDEQLQRNAIYNLCALHHQIVCDVRFKENRQLQGYRATIAKRLQGFVSDLKKQQARELRTSKREKSASTKSSNSLNHEANENGSPIEEDLSKQFTSASNAEQEQGLSSSDDAYNFGAESYYSLGQLSGGPNQMFNYAGGRFAPPWDHGPELVALIEKTINPSTWRSNGGTNTIHYFRPLRVLVLGASFKVNDNTLDLLMRLRANNGSQIQIGGGIGSNNN